MPRSSLALVLLLLPGLLLTAQEKKTDKKDLPRVIVASPLGIAPGKAAKVVLRGHKLDTATAVRVSTKSATVRLLSKGKAAVPAMQEAARVGDTQAEVEITLPPEVPTGTVELVVVTPTGESAAYRLFVDGAPGALAEREPNNGFAQAQAVARPQTIDGVISPPQDVDVYRFDGKAGQRVVLEAQAARHGSALDSFLSLYDASGRLLASNDDADGTTDSRIEATLPRDGAYLVSVIDAHDQGGPAHVYRLVIR